MFPYQAAKQIQPRIREQLRRTAGCEQTIGDDRKVMFALHLWNPFQYHNAGSWKRVWLLPICSAARAAIQRLMKRSFRQKWRVGSINCATRRCYD